MRQKEPSATATGVLLRYVIVANAGERRPVEERYRGIAKNGAQVLSLLALANIFLVRDRLASA